ncbi:MAG: hypothetical protein HY328_03390 [Chloroflexi bacterium]|nr:hypothetical protein [Chloroflexota bacterium]
MTTLTACPYRGDEDFWRVRQLLIDIYSITPTGFNWEVRRWDGTRFHDPDPHHNNRLYDSIGFSEVQRAYAWRNSFVEI